MESWQAIVSLAIFIGVIGSIALEWVHLTIAGLLGALLLVVLNILTLDEAIGYIAKSHPTLGLFFGVMVMVRTLQPTLVFEYLATQMVLWSQGKGKRLLLGIVAITTPICAVLPNATTVMLLAPLIPPLAQEIGVDFVPLLILMVFIANSAGLLTIVGDPATFIVGSSIDLTFVEYLQRLSFGGAIAVLTVVVTLPFLFKGIWRMELPDLDNLPRITLKYPRMLLLGGGTMLLVMIFFVIGEMLPIPISPATAALLGGTLCLLWAQQIEVDSIDNILRDVDWSTLLFFMSIFVLIGGLQKTGVISSLSIVLALLLGKNIALGSIVLLFSVGLLSSVIPNIPLVVAMVPLLQEYLVNAGFVGAEILRPGANVALPPVVLPLFYAMMYGATLGGNGTLIGASANIVAAGISAHHGAPISFRRFLAYGLPTMGLQLVVLATYVSIAFLR
ncbi:SLC13 family permease [Chamaesiphon minutus]|uniref:Na+/H+ antiporter NhaD-like permease n=1 Tax=Chamaesiphon minutus (strain ATCC 27169 / PCC 6605) TaxID=1173020 RepID=K9UP90_CHAP6|nr:SLC13 family permease [Chamaesiphon minutus]AFY96635.1 Na+/H+ antiporter NhaD-like permease [Chamaesiphon minutus PCC 6605]